MTLSSESVFSEYLQEFGSRGGKLRTELLRGYVNTVLFLRWSAIASRWLLPLARPTRSLHNPAGAVISKLYQDLRRKDTRRRVEGRSMQCLATSRTLFLIPALCPSPLTRNRRNSNHARSIPSTQRLSAFDVAGRSIGTPSRRAG